MKRLSALVAASFVIFAFSAGFSSDIAELDGIDFARIRVYETQRWSEPGILSFLHGGTSGTVAVNTYGSVFSKGGRAVGIVGIYVLGERIGVDFLTADLRDSETNSKIDRITFGIFNPDGGLNCSYIRTSETPTKHRDDFSFSLVGNNGISIPIEFLKKGFARIYYSAKLGISTFEYPSPYGLCESFGLFSGFDEIKVALELWNLAFSYDRYETIGILRQVFFKYETLGLSYTIADFAVLNVGVASLKDKLLVSVDADFSYAGLNFNVGYEFGDCTNFAASIGGRF